MNPSDNRTPHLAAVYDEQVRNTIPYYDHFHQETVAAVKAAGINPHSWLDTGCGTDSLVMLAQAAFPEARFQLADPSVEMLAIAQSKLNGCERVRFLAPTATQDLELTDPVDVVTAIQAHHYLAPELRRQATRVCYRLLRKNGIYITFENIRPFTDAGLAIGKQRWAAFQADCGKDEAAVQKHLARIDFEFFPITVGAHLGLLRECGFKSVELLWYSCMQAGFLAVK